MANPCSWRKPALDRAGQLKFWDRQFDIYETADMTVDNAGEMDAVIEICRRIPGISNVVTFGGAVGCRDPLMIFKQAICSGCDPCKPPNRGLVNVFFNDLSPNLLATAKSHTLAKCQECGADISYHPGAILDIAGGVPPANRTLIMGVYDVKAFFLPNPDHGYPNAGFDEYIANREILGDNFWFDYLTFNGQEISRIETGMELSADLDSVALEEFKLELISCTARQLVQRPDIIGLQVVGVRKDQGGFFLSNWFDQVGLNRLVGMVFPPTEYFVQVKTFPKGFLYCISRNGVAPTGVVTVLNNVFGNVIPDEQLSTLEAIRAII
ncbi:MAG: hypothetical protein NTZ65_04530 [Candidatus Berkelbacteria bacterium]|nr:hypothetical protein [Candidatus Berkelbacteria bacterium]